MIPKGEDNRLESDFDMLIESGFANHIFITISRNKSTPKEVLFKAADQVVAKLDPTLLHLVDTGSVKPIKAIEFLLDNAPNLLTSAELSRIEKKTAPSDIQNSLLKAKQQLLSPQGMFLKQLIQHDPLNWRSILAPRLKALNRFTTAIFENGRVITKDRKAILLSAETGIPLTDADGSKHLVDSLTKATQNFPEGITAEFISGHVHTVANASAIKSDIITISLAAGAGLTILFLIFFRNRQGIGVFLAPLVALGTAMGGLALFSQTISAIVIGFGSVLIGISIDFAMHVYFAISRNDISPGTSTASVARPIFFCTLTSCMAFGALFLSDIPGIRQLAIFSMAGLIGSALFSLCILPHLCKKSSKAKPIASAQTTHPKGKYALVAWVILLILLIGGTTQSKLDPDLRSIGYEPESIQQTEKLFTKTWGEVRNSGTIFAKAQSMNEALARNEQVFLDLTQSFPDTQIVNLSGLIPSMDTQLKRRAAWESFWTQDEKDSLITLLWEQAENLGFSTNAFTPFVKSMETLPPTITTTALDSATLGLVRDMFILDGEGDHPTILTFVPDSNAMREHYSPTKETELGVRYISNGRFKAMLESAMKKDIQLFISISGLGVALLVLMLFRNIRKSTLALLPPLTGLAAVFGVLGVTGTPLNMFHITALPLVIGLGADYGIFMVEETEGINAASTRQAVKVSGLTTLTGFGVLILAVHPSLHSLGATVLIGIGSALACALYVLPSCTKGKA